MNDFEIGWITGLLEGEGSISLYRQHAKPRQILCKIVFYNTDIEIINKAIIILEKFNIKLWHRIIRQRKNHLIIKKQKPCYELYISRLDDIYNFLIIITPYLVSYKKQQAEIVLKYAKRRLNIMNKFNRMQKERRVGEKDYIFVTEYKNLNQITTP